MSINLQNQHITHFDVGKLIRNAWKMSVTVQIGSSMFGENDAFSYNSQQIPS